MDCSILSVQLALASYSAFTALNLSANSTAFWRSLAVNDFYYDLTSFPSEQQSAQVLAYCRNHPSEAIMNAVLHLAQNFLAKKPTH